MYHCSKNGPNCKELTSMVAAAKVSSEPKLTNFLGLNSKIKKLRGLSLVEAAEVSYAQIFYGKPSPLRG
jgi:hypothetical protein